MSCRFLSHKQLLVRARIDTERLTQAKDLLIQRNFNSTMATIGNAKATAAQRVWRMPELYMEIMYHSTVKYNTQIYAFWLTWSDTSFKEVVARKWATVELRKWLDIERRCPSPVSVQSSFL